MRSVPGMLPLMRSQWHQKNWSRQAIAQLHEDGGVLHKKWGCSVGCLTYYTCMVWRTLNGCPFSKTPLARLLVKAVTTAQRLVVKSFEKLDFRLVGELLEKSTSKASYMITSSIAEELSNMFYCLRKLKWEFCPFSYWWKRPANLGLSGDKRLVGSSDRGWLKNEGKEPHGCDVRQFITITGPFQLFR